MIKLLGESEAEVLAEEEEEDEEDDEEDEAPIGIKPPP